jgi:DNA-binding HxlR family transcriptional regulator
MAIRLPDPTAPDGAVAARGNCFKRQCPGRSILAHLTGRWGSLIATALRKDGTLRFSELRDRIEGISEKMLAQTLRDLENDGLVSRLSRGTVPPHVEYSLTPMGEGAAMHVEALVNWVESNVRQVVETRRAHESPGARMVGSATAPRDAARP